MSLPSLSHFRSVPTVLLTNRANSPGLYRFSTVNTCCLYRDTNRYQHILSTSKCAEFDTTHPAVPKRIEALKALIKKYPPQTLKREGEARIAKSQALTYSLSRDKKTLRINSVRGSSAGDDIERMFDK